MRVRRTLTACLGLLALAGAVSAPPASAHGGTRIVTRIAGGYRVALDARAVRNGESVAVVDYTAYLQARTTGRPIDDAHVVVTVHAPGTALGPLVARRQGNTYETLIPVAKPGDWQHYRLDIRISSPSAGTAQIAYRPPTPAFDWLWRQPLVLAGALFALGLYLRAFLRLRRRGRRDLASIGRLLTFTAGIALALLALLSPIDPIGERYLLSVHMFQHVLIGDAAPALLIAGLRGPMSLLIVPAAILRRLARSSVLRDLGHALLSPPVALGLWAAVFAGWHIPAVYDAALAHRDLHDLEHASFLVAGLLVWTQLVDPLPRQRLTPRRRMGVAVVLFALGSVLADVLILEFHALYPAYASQPVRMWGLTPLTDQRLAGGVMMIEQLLTLTTCMAFLVRADRRAQHSVGASAVAVAT